jgi:type IV pilus assembly protein PilC
MTPDDISALNDQIAAMARAGLPLDQGLESLAKEMGSGELRTVSEALASGLRAGQSLPEALARQEGRIPPYYANLVTAGLQTGRLPQVLATLTAYARSISTVRGAIFEALLYPSVILVVGIVLFAFLSTWIFPQFDQIFHDFGMKVPLITEGVLALGRYRIFTVAYLGAVLLVGFVLFWAIIRFLPGGSRAFSRSVYYIPLIGKLIRAARLAAFTELLAILVEFGIPLPTAFRLAGASSSDPDMASRALEVEDRLKQGDSLAEAFRGRGLLPEWVAWLVAAGEQRSALAPALREIAEIYRRQVENRTGTLKSVFPPFIVIVVGGTLIGVFVSAIMYPMIHLLEGLSK